MKTSPSFLCHFFQSARIRALFSAVVVAICLAGNAAAITVTVSSSDDSGPKTLRDAIDQANANPGRPHHIIIRTPSIGLQSTIHYTGSDALLIDGRGVEIDGTNLAFVHVLLCDGGADVEIRDVSLQANSLVAALRLRYPASASGKHFVSFSGISIVNSGHAVSINDFAQGNLTIEDRGSYYESEDRWGIIVDDRLDGTLRFETNGSEFNGCSEGGLKITKRTDGDLIFLNNNTVFTDNGPILPPSTLNPTANDPWGVVLQELGRGSVSVQINYSSAYYQLAQDALYVSEHGDGDIDVKIQGGSFSDNGIYGLVFWERNSGNLEVELSDVTVAGNFTVERRQGAVYLKEEQGGGVKTLISNGIIADNPSVGLRSSGLPATITLDNTLFLNNRLGDFATSPGTRVRIY